MVLCDEIQYNGGECEKSSRASFLMRAQVQPHNEKKKHHYFKMHRPLTTPFFNRKKKTSSD